MRDLTLHDRAVALFETWRGAAAPDILAGAFEAPFALVAHFDGTAFTRFETMDPERRACLARYRETAARGAQGARGVTI